MATAMVNGITNTDTSAASATPSVPGKQQSKANAPQKAGDGPRKPALPAVDSNQKKPAQHKAWSGMNPITQRSTTPASQNGNVSQARVGPQKSVPPMEVGNADKHAYDRLVYLMANFLGNPALVTLKNGEKFSGIFFGSSLEGKESKYLLKMVQRVSSSERAETNGNHETLGEYIGSGEDHAVSFETKDVADLAVDGVTFETSQKATNGLTAGFRTDNDISGKTAPRERNLQRWEPSIESETDMSLEGTGGAWDQFQANEQRFGLRSDYNENIYTTSIDRSHPDFHRREAEALRIAQEIEGGQADNAHVREERGILHTEDTMGEEEKYSGVHRNTTDYPPLQSNQANRYMPPARRPPSGKPTVAGAPVDPAIISMQMAGANSESAEKQSMAKELEDSVQTSPTKPNISSEGMKEARKAPPENDVASSASRPGPQVKSSKVGESATANVENEVLDSFRQFASTEKMKFQDHRRQRVTQDKAIKLNDLMKFSQNFKLGTPVPKDLVPILAKDKAKQDAIIEKAQRNAETTATSAQTPSAASRDRKAPKAEAAKPTQENTSSRQMVPPQGPQATIQGRERPQQLHNGIPSSKAGQGLLSHRLADSHRQHKAGLQTMSIPQPIPIQSVSKATRPSQMPVGQPANSVRTPTSASSASAKFNVRAMEFRPNPTASTFRPVAEPNSTSSPRSMTHTRSVSRPSTPSDFFGDRKPLPIAERTSISAHFNPLRRLKEKAQQEGKVNAENGGIRHAYTTPPTWSVVQDGEIYKSYKDMFGNVAPVSTRASPQHGSAHHPSLPHQHQLPMHLQQSSHGVPHVSASQHSPFHNQPQPPHFPAGPQHYEDHRMHLSASSSSVYPSPRMQNAGLAYPSPMHQSAHLAYGQPIPQYFMAPSGPQPPHFGRQFQNGPQMMPAQGTPLTAPMMVQQSSQGGYMGPPHGMALPFNPQMPMYPPGQQAGYNGPSQPSNHFPSPSRGAPMMMHQGSHQGQHQPVFMSPGQYPQPVYAQQQPSHMVPIRGYGSPQPHYNQSPQPQYHYPHQPSRAPSGSYGVQPPQGPHQHMPAQPPPPNGPVDGGEEMK
ncbi:MAG: hypothetical protein Q9220_004260 [cf. Caloplaca sp. 1 TL-2023]